MDGFDVILTCIALTVYHEARGEPYESQFAVASTVINRAVKNHAGDTCRAAFADKQFSWTEWGYDRKRKCLTARGKPTDDLAWRRSLSVANDAVYRRTMPNLYHYHTKDSKPKWTGSGRGTVGTVVAVYGTHKFYE
jgi:spore germination cell wall hydrolase CwlJ-like protein